MNVRILVRSVSHCKRRQWDVTEVMLICAAVLVGGVIGPHLLASDANAALASWGLGAAVAVIVAVCLFAAKGSYRRGASRDSLHISDSILSKHLSALGAAGYVELSRVRADSRSRGQVMLTRAGRTALRGHLAALQAIAAAAEPSNTEAPWGEGAAEHVQSGRQLALEPGIA